MESLLVCGLGRCGSSLVMQMLEAGGYPVLGDFPAYEPWEVGYNRDMQNLLSLGKAMKILDPHRTPWKAELSWRSIWLTRDPRQQAKSQVKLGRLVGGLNVSGQAWRSIAKSLPNEERECLCLLKSMPLLWIAFEDILRDPEGTANSIVRFVGRSLDTREMVACVFKRSSQCLANLDIELSLLSER